LNDYFSLTKDIGCTPAQLALAWLKAKDDNIVSIPGTRSVNHMKDNFESAQLTLDAKQVSLLDDIINQSNVHGTRYTAAQQAEIDTEEF
jgi:aryl-alcohol dehydrogenase-like predicted oxidoreductase